MTGWKREEQMDLREKDMSAERNLRALATVQQADGAWTMGIAWQARGVRNEEN